jgi:hypothetical protein
MSPIHHHFLPQVYLKHFVSPNRKNSIWEFDKTNGESRESTPKKSAYHDHFYTFTNAEGRRDNETLEKKFHDIENRIPKVYEALRRQENPLSEATAVAFVLFAASMFIRVPSYIQKVRADETIKLQKEFERVRNEPAFIAKVESIGLGRSVSNHAIVRADDSYALLSAIRGLIIPADPFARMSWYFLKAPPGNYFITGDSPVVHLNPNITHAPFEVDLQDPDIEVTFPFSRTLCALGKWETQQERYRMANEETVRIVNYRTWQAAVRYAYSPANSCPRWDGSET